MNPLKKVILFKNAICNSIRYNPQNAIFEIFSSGFNHEITNNKTKTNLMPVFRVTVKTRQYRDGICLEPGMSVDVSTPNFGNPIVVNGGQCVADAFMRVYGIDIKKAGGLSIGILQADRIG